MHKRCPPRDKVFRKLSAEASGNALHDIPDQHARAFDVRETFGVVV